MNTKFTIPAVAAIAVLLFSTNAWSRGGPGGPGGRGKQGPPPHVLIQDHAAELGIDQATVDKIVSIAKANRSDVMKTQHALQRERLALKQMLDMDQPNKADIMKQVELVGNARTTLRKLELSILIDIRNLLTSDQLDKLRRMRRKLMRKRHMRRGRRGGQGRAGMPPGRGMKRGKDRDANQELDNDWL
jgi:Spy/CpxP family protein refolding chaperone